MCHWLRDITLSSNVTWAQYEDVSHMYLAGAVVVLCSLRRGARFKRF